MKNVTIKKEELLARIKSNRKKHRAIFVEALNNYRLEAVAVLERGLKDAKAGRRIMQSTGLIQPMDQTREYDRAIEMLTMSVDKHIELDSRSFDQLVMDRWDWMDQFNASNRAYVKSAAALAYLDKTAPE